jgi:hypothetical protein
MCVQCRTNQCPSSAPYPASCDFGWRPDAPDGPYFSDTLLRSHLLILCLLPLADSGDLISRLVYGVIMDNGGRSLKMFKRRRGNLGADRVMHPVVKFSGGRSFEAEIRSQDHLDGARAGMISNSHRGKINYSPPILAFVNYKQLTVSLRTMRVRTPLSMRRAYTLLPRSSQGNQ